MSLLLFDSARAAKVDFPRAGRELVQVYSCGPTVHSAKRLSELRPYVVVDVLKRRLAAAGARLEHVINITDVGHSSDGADAGEDKVERAARRSGISVDDTAEHYTHLFKRDLELLGVQPPDAWAHASRHVARQIEMARALEARGLTYLTAQALYFDTSKDAGYGRLFEGMPPRSEPQLRIAADPAKRRADDFALWKLAGEDQKSRAYWQSPWGRGAPGWHIECSAIASAHFGAEIDLHTGNAEHIHAHHRNAVAGAENALGVKPWVHHWLHVETALGPAGSGVHAQSPALRTLDESLLAGVAPRAARFFLLGTHYRQKLPQTREAFAASLGSYQRLLALVAALGSAERGLRRTRSGRLRKSFFDALDDDLNTPRALATLWTALKHPLLEAPEKRGLVAEMDAVLGLDLLEAAELQRLGESQMLGPAIMRLVEQRNAARADKNFARADALRVELQRLGFLVEDVGGGTRVRAQASASTAPVAVGRSA